MKQFLRPIKRRFFPATLPIYEKSTAKLPPEALAQLMPALAQQSQRFGQHLFTLGHCIVCGQATAFFCDNLAMARESLACAVCGTTSRYRALAHGLLRAIQELTGVKAASLNDLSTSTPSRALRIYDTQTPFYYQRCSYPLPDLLATLPGTEVQLSLYRPQVPLGRQLDGKPNLTNQNLERLTFPDASFDLVITSDVMEHVRLDARAHAEIRRVLKPEGIYLFNVPHTRAMRETLQRVVIHDPADPSKDEYVLEKEYHGDTNNEENAALCYRMYGTELDEHLTKLGFDVRYVKEDLPEHGILNTEYFYCRLRRS